eukprot:3232074-Pyramimonas_sp.AAC.1
MSNRIDRAGIDPACGPQRYSRREPGAGGEAWPGSCRLSLSTAARGALRRDELSPSELPPWPPPADAPTSEAAGSSRKR